MIEPSRTQQLIARRMASAKATIPEFQVTVEVDAEAALELREQLRSSRRRCRRSTTRRQGLRARAARTPERQRGLRRRALRALLARQRRRRGRRRRHARRADRVRRRHQVAGRDRRRRRACSPRRCATAPIAPAELAGGTFTVSNLGMFGVARFTAVINPPQAAILAVGAATPRSRRRSRVARITVRRIMELTISADHRIVYGAEAADFLATVRKRLETPRRSAALGHRRRATRAHAAAAGGGPPLTSVADSDVRRVARFRLSAAGDRLAPSSADTEASA